MIWYQSYLVVDDWDGAVAAVVAQTVASADAPSAFRAPKSSRHDVMRQDAGRRGTAAARYTEAGSTYAAPWAPSRTAVGHGRQSAVNELMLVNWIAVFGKRIESVDKAGG